MSSPIVPPPSRLVGLLRGARLALLVFGVADGAVAAAVAAAARLADAHRERQAAVLRVDVRDLRLTSSPILSGLGSPASSFGSTISLCGNVPLDAVADRDEHAVVDDAEMTLRVDDLARRELVEDRRPRVVPELLDAQGDLLLVVVDVRMMASTSSPFL